MIVEPIQVLRRPVVTERSTGLKEANHQFVFEVSRTASKPMIRAAIEKAFKVKVVVVNTMIVRGKMKRFGRYSGKQSNWKKAVVTLRKGDKIEMFEGV